MARSMTAYGRATSPEVEGLSWLIEIHSVNRRSLDIHMHLSRELLFLDLELRKQVASYIGRGQVTVKVSFKKENQAASVAILQRRKEAWEAIARELGYKSEAIDLPFLLSQTAQTPFETETVFQDELKKALQKALDVFVLMKEKEGKALEEDVLARLKHLEDFASEIEKLSRKSPEKYREKLVSKLEGLIADAAGDERVFREIALFAEKTDIHEEIIRLKSHFKQIKETLSSKEMSVGKKLEFLTQEMLREINTIGSKTAELEISNMTVAAKAELEKIREQVQNIE